MKKYEKPKIVLVETAIEDILAVSFDEENATFKDVYINEDF